ICALTLHRAENVDVPSRLTKVLEFILSFSHDFEVVFPIHPRTAKAIASLELDLSGIRLIDPLPYLQMQALIGTSELVMTDSGGMQKEAYFHGVPCITLRDETEWVETIDHGWNRLWSTPEFKRPQRPIPEYGTGESRHLMVNALQAFLST
ncbi:MAG: UDP-N-acetylglucosamine 2-epimerase, partial [Pseudomonadota bacterium]